MSDAAGQKLATIRRELRESFVERDEVIDGLLAALLAGEHTLVLGPVGTAKSMLASELCARLQDGRSFSWLLTKFTTPDEIFGPVSLQGLERDEYRRVTEGRLPGAHVAFLDEIFKANSAILNALLAILNEGVFHNGGAAENVPLRALIGASNELPEEGELEALYDRFLVRFVVDYIREDFRFLKMLTAADTEGGEVLSLDELDSLRARVSQVEVGQRFLGDLVELRRRLNDRGIVSSDRRYRRALQVIRAYAVLAGRDQVAEADLEALNHILWNAPGERDEVRLTLKEVFRGHEDKARALAAQAREVRVYALRDWGDAEMAMRASIEAHTKLKNILAAAETLAERAHEQGRRVEEVTAVVDEIRAIQREVLERSLHV